jgi:uncharacterized NAD(P)/FAD-binding protein YdhS
MSEQRPSIAIIGAGFTGAILAAHLLRRHTVPFRLSMINRSGRLARGVAYGIRSSMHVLNVPAGRMSAFADDEEDFLRFVRDRVPGATAGSFVPRRRYGEYLEHVLLSAEAPHAARCWSTSPTRRRTSRSARRERRSDWHRGGAFAPIASCLRWATTPRCHPRKGRTRCG